MLWGQDGLPCLQAAEVLPAALRAETQNLDSSVLARLEEFRLRRGYPMSVVVDGGERVVGERSVSEADLRTVLEQASHASAHMVLEQVRSGFITIQGGHRIGLCGEAVIREGQIHTLRALSSIAIRIARPFEGLGESVMAEIAEGDQLQSTIILAPPGVGKTTLLRELVRRISDGVGISARRVGLADERREVSAVWEGQAQFDIGQRTDIMADCPKAIALEILLRGMNPQVLAADEITADEDAEAMTWAAGCGVILIATAHGSKVDDLYRRPVYARMMERGLFQRAVVLENRDGTRTAKVEVIS